MNKSTHHNSIFIRSARELKSTVNISLSALLLALRVVCAIFTILVIPEVKIGFSFLPVSISAMLFGPFVSGVVDGLGDILGYVFNPVGGAYFPGFTISAVLTGIIYGIFFYKKNLSVKRIIICEILIAIFIELLLSSIWVSLLYDKGLFIVMSARIVKVTIMLPIRVVFDYSCSKLISKIRHPLSVKKESFTE